MSALPPPRPPALRPSPLEPACALRLRSNCAPTDPSDGKLYLQVWASITALATRVQPCSRESLQPCRSCLRNAASQAARSSRSCRGPSSASYSTPSDTPHSSRRRVSAPGRSQGGLEALPLPPHHQILWRNREAVMTDQLLRAKGSGTDRLTNPVAYDFRRRYGRSYYREDGDPARLRAAVSTCALTLPPAPCRVQAGLCLLLDSPHLW